MSLTTDVPDVAHLPAGGAVPAPLPMPAVDGGRAESLAAETVSWHALSQALASRGETREAILSMWASDVRALHLLLWENGLGAAPDAHVHVQACTAAVQAGLRAHATDIGAGPTPRLLVERARGALASAFDASVHDLLAGRLLPLDHLDDIRQPPEGARGDLAPDRLAGRTPAQLLVDLRAAACDCVTVARALAGDVEETNRQLWQAALASFEAYLVDTALRVGDARLTTVELHWELAARALATGPEQGASDAWWLRQRLLAVAGPHQRAALDAEFVLAGEWPR